MRGEADIKYDWEKKCYHVYEDGKFIIRAHVIRHSVFCLGYVIEEKLRPGNVNMQKAREMGLIEGPLIGQLKQGHSVTTSKGIVRPEDVLEAPLRPRKIVILGDTCDPSSIAHLAMGADVLIHEATNSDEERAQAMLHMHSTAGMAGEFARRIRAKNLIITHFSPRNFHANEYNECVHVRTLVGQARATFGRSNVFPAAVIVICS
jgi:ribonuclease Z